MKKLRNIYMDYASSARADSANPGAIHALGVGEKARLEKARKVISDVLSAQANEIIFTSGATESNNLAILGILAKTREIFHPTYAKRNSSAKKFHESSLPHVVTTNIEHASVLETCKHFGNVTFVPVEKNGIVDPKKIKKALRPNTALVSVMYANNEIGTVQPIREIAKEIRHYRKEKAGSFSNGLVEPRRGTLGATRGPEKNFLLSPNFPYLHTDATQAINYLPITVPQLGVDMMSFNSAKIYGPKGVGVLFVKRGTPLSPIMFGGEQERGLRPGTENVALAVGIAEALRETEKIKNKEVVRLKKLQDYFIAELSLLFSHYVRPSRIPRSKKETTAQLTINGDIKNRLPNNINITIPNIPSDLLVIELSARGIMASAKSACKSGDGKASHVIQAINPNLSDTDGSLRFSLGRETTKKDIDDTIKALSEILKKLKKWYY